MRPTDAKPPRKTMLFPVETYLRVSGFRFGVLGFKRRVHGW